MNLPTHPSPTDREDEYVSPSVFEGGPLACARCGFVPREGGLLQITDRGVECVDRSACNQRKANR